MSAGADRIPAYARGYEGFTGRIDTTMDESEPAWHPRPQARDGAPNIILMVIDDMGFSDLGPFGGDAETPTINALAKRGVVATNYHSPTVCSPARASLLTGINPHRSGFATVAGADPGYPGCALELDEQAWTLPEILRGNGYSTFAVGKWHLASEHGQYEGGPRHSWPCQRGFDQYYGCLEGYTQFFAPNRLIRDNTTVEVERYPEDYYLTDDLTDQAISMIRGLRSSDPEKPFFLYFAHNAMHGPLGAKQADIEKYRGRYAAGWDTVRRARFERQKQLGLFPASAAMVERNYEPGYDVDPWDALTAEERALAEREMEVYAAMVDNIDQNLARLLAAVQDYGDLDNTIVVIVSDNGGTAEGGPRGTRSYFSQFLTGVPVPEDWDRDRPIDLDLVGGPQTMPHYPRGWAMASNTPFRLYKTTQFEGGVRVPFLFSWPRGLPKGSGDSGIRHQYLYTTDVLPTLLEAAGVERPWDKDGIPAKEPDGISALSVLRDPGASETRTVQYGEFAGQRSIYRGGWKIAALHRPGTDLDDGAFQLFNIAEDPAETTNLAARHPQKLREMIELWYRTAWENTVFPLATNPAMMFAARRPGTEHLADAVTIFPGTPTLERFRSIELVSLRDLDIEVDFTSATDIQGVLVAHGDQGGGYVLYAEDGQLVFEYNEYGIMHRVTAPLPAPGRRTARLSAKALPRFHWGFTLRPDVTDPGNAVALEPVMIMAGMAPFTGIDVGIDRRGPVSWAMHERHGSFRFTGKLHQVRYLPGPHADYDQSALLRAQHIAAKVFD